MFPPPSAGIPAARPPTVRTPTENFKHLSDVRKLDC